MTADEALQAIECEAYSALQLATGPSRPERPDA